MSSSCRLLVVAFALAIIIAEGSVVYAGSILSSGQTVSGWTITFPAGVALIDDNPSGVDPVIYLEKAATFESADALNITFTQSGSAANQIDFVDEVLSNHTGDTWTGFDFSLSNSQTGNGGAAVFAGSGEVFAPAADNHFTTDNFTPTLVSYSGRSVTDGSVIFFGTPGEGDLVIDANPSTNVASIFQFSETPVGAFSSGPLPAVPLPTAVGLGLSGLAGVIIFRLARRAKKARC